MATMSLCDESGQQDAQIRVISRKCCMYRREVMAMVICALGPLSTGAMTGFSSPTLSELIDEGLLTKSEASWFGSIITLGAMIGALFAGVILDRWGRQRTLMICGVTFVLGWIPVVAAQDFIPLLIGRFITGLAGGLSSLSVPVYIAEIASAKRRGLLNGCAMAGSTLGTLLAFSSGLFLPWRWLAIACIIPPTCLTLGSVLLPETPRWLLLHNDGEGARRALFSFRLDAETTVKELHEIKETISHLPSQIAWSELRRRDISRPLMLVVFLMIVQQFCGINAVIFYTQSIFETSGYDGNPGVPPVLIALVKVIAACTSSLMMDRVGRKTLFAISGIFMTISCTVFGVYFYCLQDHGVSWVSVACLVVYTMAFCSAWNSIPWILMSEVFPLDARGRASTVATVVNWMGAFVVTVSFLPAQELMQPYGVFWFFAVVCLLGTIGAAIFQPETKGKTLEEIRELFISCHAGPV